jgi:hypothetical protein
MIIPLQWFIENPFQNWTRTSADIMGTVFLHVDYAAPIEAIRAEAKRLVEAAPEWDGRVFNLQVTDARERCLQLRVLVSSANAGRNWTCAARSARAGGLPRGSIRRRCRWCGTNCGRRRGVSSSSPSGVGRNA